MSDVGNRLSSDILLEFLEAAVHTIIHARNLYPETIFVKKKIYGTPVHCSIHPEVNTYITESLKGVQELIKKKEVKKVAVVFSNKEQIPIEKFVVDIRALYSQASIEDTFYIHTEENLRASLLKITLVCKTLKKLPEDCTFSIQIHTTETASLSLTDDPKRQENFPWIHSEEKSVKVTDGKIIPIRQIDTEYLHLQLYILESTTDK